MLTRPRACLRAACLSYVLASNAGVAYAQGVAPPNEPAVVTIDGTAITMRYAGTTLFEGRIDNPDALASVKPSTAVHGQSVDQVVALWARRGGPPLRLSGRVTASDQAFAAESDRPVRGVPIVRHSSGPSRSLRNQAVYDRRHDWVLSVDDQPRTRTRITPQADAGTPRHFAIEITGTEIVLRFRPRFFQRHRGLAFYEPWTYDIWPTPVVGWTSWFAFFDKVTEQDVRHTADVLSQTLRPFGYDYLQIDDGYQRGTGLPSLWLEPNAKFPSGLEALASYIRSRGLKPGIWTNATFSQTEYAEQHPEWFVRDASGRVARGNWIDHPVDASAPGALDTLVRPIYRSLRSMGWDYVKLDALRHLRYEGYNTHRAHFDARSVDPAAAFRSYVGAVRQELGRETFLLACWGIRPELIGLVDGCRLGTDGFSYAGLSQFNSFNNVVWRNDPDHVELSEAEAWRSTMVTSLTGSMLLLTDKPERYLTPFVEPARRAAPVLFTVPGQLYDVDPSRSSELSRVESDVSGREPKPFDAGLTPAVDLYALEITRPFESWMVLGRTGGHFEAIRFEDLGLDPARRYLVFDYWLRQADTAGHLVSFAPGALPAAINAQVFVIREQLDRPQVMATSRHITGGGVDLVDVSWSDGVLTGRSRVVADDPYEIFLTEPDGWSFDSMRCDGATPRRATRGPAGLVTGCTAASSGEVTWRATFTRRVP